MAGDDSSNAHGDALARQAAVEAAGADWQVAAPTDETPSHAELRRRLGARPPAGTLAGREAGAKAKLAAAGAVAAPPRPAKFSWRSVGGKNYVTPIRDQGDCGSCVAFGVAATIESTARVRYGANLAIDLSEAQLFYCIGRTSGATCGYGWWPDYALDGAGNPGVTDGHHFPYTAGDQGCGLRSGWQDVVTKVAQWHVIDDVEQMKQWIATKGPLTTCFTVYEDFYDYAGGVYRHVYGAEEGGHCVSVVGYDDTKHCWLAKNSWNTWWGDGGFLQIAYGQCGFDFEMYAVDSLIVPAAGLTPLYRYWSHNATDHFYTTNWSELGSGGGGYVLQETQCYLYPTHKSGTVPLHRFWSTSRKDHVYTTDRNEYGRSGDGYAYEGIVGYAYAAAHPKALPLYRYWSASRTDHLFTNSKSEGANAAGYVLQKTTCWVPGGPA